MRGSRSGRWPSRLVPITASSALARARYPIAFAAAGLAVAGPLLGGGVILGGDLALPPHFRLPTDYWGVSAGTHAGPPSRLPLDAVFALLGRVGAVAAGEQVLLVLIVLLAGWGMTRAAAVRGTGAQMFAGLLYAVNPFVYDRLWAGQWFLLLGYALIPHVWAEIDRGRGWRAGVLVVCTAVASLHMAALLVFLLVVRGVALRGERRLLAAVLVGAGLVSLYWLVPVPGLRDLWHHVGGAQLTAYQSEADPRWGLPITLAGLYGFWNDPSPMRAFVSFWPLVTLVLVLLAIWGAAVRRRDPRTWVIVVAGAVGFLLALGHASPLTRPIFDAMLRNVAPARSFRESEKGLALLAFAYAWLGSTAVGDLVAAGRRSLRALATVALVAVAFLAGFRTYAGLWGRMHNAAYPSSWAQVADLLPRQSSTLFLPFSAYWEADFAHYRLLADPAALYFARPLLVSKQIGSPGLQDVSDPVDARILVLLAHPKRLRACLAQYGVTHVLVYGYSPTLPLPVERRLPELTLYATGRPAGLVMAAKGGGCDGSYRPLRTRRLDPAHYRLVEKPGPGEHLVVALPNADWKLHGDVLEAADWPAYRRNYLLGLGGLAVVLAGAVIRRVRR